MTIKVLYDPALFYTDEEFQKKNGYPCDIQEIVETPLIYILGHCHDSIAEKLTYIEERLKDVEEMAEPLVIEEARVQDTLRFFHGMVYSMNTQQFDSYKCTQYIQLKKSVN